MLNESLSLFSRAFCARRYGYCLMVTLLVVGTGGTAGAQPYQTDPNFDKTAGNRLLVQRCLKDPAEYAANKEKFEEFFSKYYFPKMTRPSPDALAELGKDRYELFTRYLWPTTNADLQKHLTELARVAMEKIIANPAYHPAVRYNAVLIMGMLDEQYAIENRRPPKPLPRGTKVLTVIVERASDGNQFPPPVVLGALVGLERHAQYRDSLDPAAVEAMTAALVKLLNHEQPIQDMDSEVYSWLRLRAASALAQLGSPGTKGEVHEALIKLMNGQKSLDDRTAAAGLLEKIKYAGAQIDARTTVEALVKLASDLAAAEGKRAREFEESAAGLSGARVAGVTSGLYSDPLSDQQAFPRRQVLARLVDLRRGLRAVKPALDEEGRAKLDTIDKTLGPAIAATSSQDGNLAVAHAVGLMADAIEAITATAETPANPAPPAEAPEKNAPEPPAAAPPAAPAGEAQAP